jgi:hypothetical protein
LARVPELTLLSTGLAKLAAGLAAKLTAAVWAGAILTAAGLTAAGLTALPPLPGQA